jgi:hypothetical protein
MLQGRIEAERADAQAAGRATWAMLEPSSRDWRGVVMTPRSVVQIERLRRRQPPRATEAVIAA